jgi:hypothetical protein
MAYILAGEVRARRAPRLFGAMEHLRSTSQVLIAPLLHDVFASFPQRVREDLPPSVFAEEQALGAQMNLEQALAYAFSETENTAESTAAWQSEK